MAKNYTIAEAVQIIAENGDNEALVDLGKRYPLLTQKITRVATRAGEDFVDLMSFMPEYLSANKVNSAIKKMLDELPVADEDDEEVEEDKPAKKVAPKKTSKAGSPKKEEVEDEDDDEDIETDSSYDYDSMNNAKMYKLLGELGKRKDCKEKMGDLSHDSMLKYLKKYGPKSGDAADEDDVEESEDVSDDYEGKTAVELYKLCKQRKIKADQKKPAKYYIGLLKKADEAASDTDDDEDWGEDDEEEEASAKKPTKKSTPVKKAASAKKPAKRKPEPEEVEDDEDDDEEWDI